MTSRRSATAGLAAAALAAATLAGCTQGGGGGIGPVGPGAPPTSEPGPGTDGIQKGPAPTDASLSANRGPFAISQVKVGRGSGYGGGTIFFPTQPGTYAGIAVVPGFMSYENSIQWYGPRLASHGFVVHTIDTNTVMDQPSQRARQLESALRTITSDSRVAGKVDRNRLGLMGWSMGGGGTFEAAQRQSAVKAIIPLAPWQTNTNFRSLRTPTLIVSCGADTVAPNAIHSDPLYRNVGATAKANFTIPGGSHWCVTTTPNQAIGKAAVAWMKRFLDDDRRYDPFYCKSPGFGATGWRANCG